MLRQGKREVRGVKGSAKRNLVLGFGFRRGTDLGFRVSPRRRSWVSGFGGAGGETPLGADYVSTPATRGGARRPQPRRRQWRRDVPRQRRPCRERRASGHFGDQNSFGRVSCFTFRWVAVFRVSLFGRQPCFVFHFSVFHVFRVSAGRGVKHRWGPNTSNGSSISTTMCVIRTWGLT